MIELRWVGRLVQAPEHGPNICKETNVLQFREVGTRGLTIRGSGNQAGFESYETAWQDVPHHGREPQGE